jgi:hypothetical protein
MRILLIPLSLPQDQKHDLSIAKNVAKRFPQKSITHHSKKSAFRIPIPTS